MSIPRAFEIGKNKNILNKHNKNFQLIPLNKQPAIESFNKQILMDISKMMS